VNEREVALKQKEEVLEDEVYKKHLQDGKIDIKK